MVKVDNDLVKYVANLASLTLTEEEEAYYEKQMSRVLEYFNELDKLTDSLGDDWRADTIGDPTPERSDAVAPSLDPEDGLAAAPAKAGSAFQVPRIIE